MWAEPNSSGEICRAFQRNGTCRFKGQCMHQHGPNDTRGGGSNQAAAAHPPTKPIDDAANKHKAMGQHCFIFQKTGKCQFGNKCKYIHASQGSSHMASQMPGQPAQGPPPLQMFTQQIPVEIPVSNSPHATHANMTQHNSAYGPDHPQQQPMHMMPNYYQANNAYQPFHAQAHMPSAPDRQTSAFGLHNFSTGHPPQQHRRHAANQVRPRTNTVITDLTERTPINIDWKTGKVTPRDDFVILPTDFRPNMAKPSSFPNSSPPNMAKLSSFPNETPPNMAKPSSFPNTSPPNMAKLSSFPNETQPSKAASMKQSFDDYSLMKAAPLNSIAMVSDGGHKLDRHGPACDSGASWHYSPNTAQYRAKIIPDSIIRDHNEVEVASGHILTSTESALFALRSTDPRCKGVLFLRRTHLTDDLRRFLCSVVSPAPATHHVPHHHVELQKFKCTMFFDPCSVVPRGAEEHGGLRLLG